MHVSRTNSNHNTYHLNNVPLDSVLSYKYLGVHITNNLSWATHVEYVINNANRMLGYLRRNFSKAPSSLKLVLYKSLIRPKLEYASAIWDPSHANLITSLQLVQNNSARFILSNYNRTASMTSMKNNLSLIPLAHRRKIARLSLFHKIFYHPTLHNDLILLPLYISNRVDHRNKVGIASCHTRSFFQSFIPRTSHDWNRLPSNVATITDFKLFHETLDNIV